MTVRNDPTSKPSKPRKKRKTETSARRTGYDSVKKYQYKEGLYCDLCQEEIYRSTIKTAGIQHVYDAFSDSGKFFILCNECARDADNVIMVSKLFPSDLTKQLSRLTYYLSRDTVELLGFFRLLERIATGLEMKQDITFGADRKLSTWCATSAGNEKFFLKKEAEEDTEYDDSNDDTDTEEALLKDGFHLDDDE